jgi:CDP-ribitol ribitolphosphotransferase / teichoic acid ribitol-phosphate polymerase
MRILIAVATWIAQGLYAVLKALFPVRRKAVFLSRQSDRPSRDFILLAEELRRRDPDLEIVMRCRMVGRSFSGRIAAIAPTIGQMYHLATARVCVVDGYVIPVSLLTHRPGFYVVQLWHALGAVKRFGYQALDRPGGRSSSLASAMRMHRNYDVVLCAGPATVPVFAEAFGVDPSVVRPTGLPRVDYLRAHADDARVTPVPPVVAAMRRAFPVLDERERTVVLYAPTFRRDGGERYRDVAERFFGARYTLIIKPHPLEAARVEGPEVVNAGEIDILDLLPLCDVVITDYSAVAFEACVLDLPVFFWVYDIDEYVRAHGLNIDVLAEMPQVSSRDLEELAGRIDARDRYPEVTRMLKDRYASAPAGCTGRIADLIFEAIGTH